MFAISHAYITSKVLGRTNNLLMLGSFLPDIRVVTEINSPLDRLHNEPVDFLKFIKEKYPNLIDLGISVRLHCSQDKGADFYSDNHETGYAVIKAEEIKSEAGELIHDSGRNALVVAHNFIEAALDLKLQESDKEIGTIYQAGIDKVDYKTVAKCLAEYFGMSKNEVENDLLLLKDYFSLEHLSTSKSFAELFPKPIQKRYGVQIDGLDPVIELIERSKLIITDSYIDYYKNTISEIKNNLGNLLARKDYLK